MLESTNDLSCEQISEKETQSDEIRDIRLWLLSKQRRGIEKQEFIGKILLKLVGQFWNGDLPDRL